MSVPASRLVAAPAPIRESEGGALRLVEADDQRCFQLVEMLRVVGPDAVVSHAAAAHLWGWSDLVPWRAEVSAPRSDRYSLRKVRAHRTVTIGAADITRRHGIPLTTVARTIVDLSGRCPMWTLLEMFDRGCARGWVAADELLAVAQRLHQAPGRRRSVVRAVAGARSETVLRPRSALRMRTEAIAHAAGLPRFTEDIPVRLAGGIAVLELAYPGSRVAVRCPAHVGADEHEGAVCDGLRRAGWRVVPVSWRMSDAECVAAIGRALTRRG